MSLGQQNADLYWRSGAQPRRESRISAPRLTQPTAAHHPASPAIHWLITHLGCALKSDSRRPKLRAIGKTPCVPDARNLPLTVGSIG